MEKALTETALRCVSSGENPRTGEQGMFVKKNGARKNEVEKRPPKKWEATPDPSAARMHLIKAKSLTAKWKLD